MKVRLHTKNVNEGILGKVHAMSNAMRECEIRCNFANAQHAEAGKQSLRPIQLNQEIDHDQLRGRLIETIEWVVFAMRNNFAMDFPFAEECFSRSLIQIVFDLGDPVSSGAGSATACGFRIRSYSRKLKNVCVVTGYAGMKVCF